MAKKVFEKLKEQYIFKKGEIYSLDAIYFVQSIGGGDWWNHCCDNKFEDDDEPNPDSENVVITRDISFTISIKKQVLNTDIV